MNKRQYAIVTIYLLSVFETKPHNKRLQLDNLYPLFKFPAYPKKSPWKIREPEPFVVFQDIQYNTTPAPTLYAAIPQNRQGK